MCAPLDYPFWIRPCLFIAAQLIANFFPTHDLQVDVKSEHIRKLPLNMDYVKQIGFCIL